jgi:hypothetical protein
MVADGRASKGEKRGKKGRTLEERKRAAAMAVAVAVRTSRHSNHLPPTLQHNTHSLRHPTRSTSVAWPHSDSSSHNDRDRSHQIRIHTKRSFVTCISHNLASSRRQVYVYAGDEADPDRKHTSESDNDGAFQILDKLATTLNLEIKLAPYGSSAQPCLPFKLVVSCRHQAWSMPTGK